MIHYIPRPGSKTEAAVAYLAAHGGAATTLDIAEHIDTERKNLPAQFKAAIENGLIEACDLPEGVGYRLCGADAPGTARPAPVKKSPSPLAGEGRGEGGEPATEIRPYLGKMPKAKPTKPRKPKTPVADLISGTGKMVPPLPNPSPAGGEGLQGFRVGEYSDGAVRLEGLAPVMIITDGAGELPSSVMLSPAAARLLVAFLHPVMDVKQ